MPFLCVNIDGAMHPGISLNWTGHPLGFFFRSSRGKSCLYRHGISWMSQHVGSDILFVSCMVHMSTLLKNVVDGKKIPLIVH